MFPADVTEINDLVSFAKREGTVYYFNGPMPVFSHAESDRASFRMFSSQLVVNGNCTQAQLVRAFGISVISMKRYVKQYRQSAVNDNYSSLSATIKTHCDTGLAFYVVSVSFTVPNPLGQPLRRSAVFGAARRQRRSGAEGALAGAPGQPPPFSFGRGTRMVSPSNSKMMA